MTILSIRFIGDADSRERMEITFTNDLGDIDRVNEAFEKFAARQGLPDRVRRSIKIVFDELLNNIISYAFDDEEEHVLEVRVESAPEKITVTISDDGASFDPFGRAEPQVDLPIEERDLGGLGIHLVRQLMDEVSYTRYDDQNVAVLVKHVEISGA
jgi:sigma-B regulation protein RsbU (phosphoserine phosphatase)